MWLRVIPPATQGPHCEGSSRGAGAEAREFGSTIYRAARATTPPPRAIEQTVAPKLSIA